ncbi:hypothetical protein, partial [uncultured Rikenella sp.]|uniref:hypothetical protein n=1 Tax=uncultured Rikenella sp. TaxID=368003 RepID=UPI0026153935
VYPNAPAPENHSPTNKPRSGPPAAGGCASICRKSFWFFLFTTDAASENNANIVCKVPSGQEENERSEVKKNSTLQISTSKTNKIMQ